MTVTRWGGTLGASGLFGLVAAMAWGCSGELMLDDAGAGMDAGRVGVDAGGAATPREDAAALGDDGGNDVDGGSDIDAQVVPVDAGPLRDAGAELDAGAGDGGWDGSAPDAGGPPAEDAGWDAGPDGSWDAGFDGGWDAGLDGGWDAGFDGGWDAGFDAAPPAMCSRDADCPPLVACTSPTGLTTQTFRCVRGFCAEDSPSTVDCAASDRLSCGSGGVVSMAGTCEAGSARCVSQTTTTACASPRCDASRNHVTESCVEAGGGASCVATTTTCPSGSTSVCVPGTSPASPAATTITTQGCDDTAGCGTTTTTAACVADAARGCEVDHRAGLDPVYWQGRIPSCDRTHTVCLAGGAAWRPMCGFETFGCSGGTRQTYWPCDDVDGCLPAPPALRSERVCLTSSPSCDTDAMGRPQHVTFTPACASSFRCSGGTPSAETCTSSSPDVCASASVLRTFSATCDPASRCGETSSDAVCPDGATTCDGSHREQTLTIRHHNCSGGACGTVRGSLSCSFGGSVCVSPNAYLSCTGSGQCNAAEDGCTSGCHFVTCSGATPWCRTNASGVAGCYARRT